ncbi:MAG: FtsX-like permease family protein [Methylophilaceae bacterium]
MMAWSLAWRQLRSHWAAGEVRILFAALILAVAATTAVSFFTDRVQSALESQGGLLLGADLVVTADHALPAKFLQQVQKIALKSTSMQSTPMKSTQVLEFRSMVVRGEISRLAEIKAVNAGFPLRGDLTIAHSESGAGQIANSIPQAGTVWIEPGLANALTLKVGDALEVGERKLVVSAILQREPSRGGNMFNIAPRLLMNAADVPSTQLLQFGSRVKYQLLLAADAPVIGRYAAWAKPQLARGEHLEDVSEARPEIKNALEKSRQFLGLSAMVGVILAMVAMFLVSLPFVQNSRDTYAMMRCLGASQRLILQILLAQTLLIALFGSVIGCLLGFAAQAGLATLAGSLFLENLPGPGWMPIASGMLTGFATMLAVVWPHLSGLRHVPALRILRRDAGDEGAIGWLNFAPGILVVALMILWQAGSVKLGGIMVLAFVGLLALIGLMAWSGGKLLQRLPTTSNSALKLGLAGLKRRPLMAVAQIVGFSLGLMALILLALVRGDLLQSWQASLPRDAPNRFIINIQAAQIDGITRFFAQAGIQAEVLPMVRGRLLAINAKPLNSEKYQDERARRLAEREFNLSWAAQMQSDNQLLAGRWWSVADSGKPLLSLEQGLAESLKIKLGDKLTYDIAGSPITLTVSSLRKVEWDTLRTNFFAVTPPGVLDEFAASYITSFHLPLGQEPLLNRLVSDYSNFTVIDLSALMEQIHAIMSKMTHALEYVFAFSLLAGVTVLYAALVATREERVREATLLRVLGASKKQIVSAVLTEFFCIGVLAATVASVAASLLAYYISVQVLNIAYHFNGTLALLALAGAALLVPFAAWLGIRGFLQQPPRQLLQSS